jgi:hypothetical protein
MNLNYKDSLVEVSDDGMVFHRYYFPLGGDKHVPLNRIESVKVGRNSFFGGKWRIWGTGDFRTWFPEDWGRPGRDRVFFASLRDSYRRIGFTVENSENLIAVLKTRGLLSDAPLS